MATKFRTLLQIFLIINFVFIATGYTKKEEIDKVLDSIKDSKTLNTNNVTALKSINAD